MPITLDFLIRHNQYIHSQLRPITFQPVPEYMPAITVGQAYIVSLLAFPSYPAMPRHAWSSLSTAGRWTSRDCLESRRAIAFKTPHVNPARVSLPCRRTWQSGRFYPAARRELCSYRLCVFAIAINRPVE